MALMQRYQNLIWRLPRVCYSEAILREVISNLCGEGGICSSEKALRANSSNTLLRLIRDFPDDKRLMFRPHIQMFVEISQQAVFQTLHYWKKNGTSSSKEEDAPFSKDSIYDISESLGIWISESVMDVDSGACANEVLSRFLAEYEVCISEDMRHSGDYLTKGSVIARLLTCIGSLSKAFKFQKGYSAEISSKFSAVLDSTLRIMFTQGAEELSAQHTEFRQSVIFYLQRMVDALGPNLLKSVGQIIEAFLQTTSAQTFHSTLSLISQMVAKFDSSFIDVMDSIWLLLLSKYHEYLQVYNGSDAVRDDPSSGELFAESRTYRQNFASFCGTVFKKSCGAIYLSQRNVEYVSDFLSTLHEMHVSFSDRPLTKCCFFVYRKILELISSGGVHVPAEVGVKLHAVLMQQILPASVLILHTRLDSKDAESHSLVRDFIKFHAELQKIWAEELSFSLMTMLGERGVQQDIAHFYVSNLNSNTSVESLKQILVANCLPKQRI
eukprot:TRINITY_DN19907_c0_g1_i1.p1 TRINITY_DN19907_c0_g1~~TRINITY_DN19907_c0_g1_i1.p1  ORF type:complete len:496 (+),score=108.07 TRINITY_DN19907_c0_g1_i1:561-2048(+)